jgi:hypothetical protein
VHTRAGHGEAYGAALAQASWLETERTRLANLVPIVRGL